MEVPAEAVIAKLRDRIGALEVDLAVCQVLIEQLQSAGPPTGQPRTE